MTSKYILRTNLHCPINLFLPTSWEDWKEIGHKTVIILDFISSLLISFNIDYIIFHKTKKANLMQNLKFKFVNPTLMPYTG